MAACCFVRWTASRLTAINRTTPQTTQQEAALAVDEAIRQHLGPECLTNYDAETGAFLDPKRALDPSAAGVAVGTAGNAARAGLVVSFVPELGSYKAVARRKGRPVLVGLFASAEEVSGSLGCFGSTYCSIGGGESSHVILPVSDTPHTQTNVRNRPNALWWNGQRGRAALLAAAGWRRRRSRAASLA